MTTQPFRFEDGAAYEQMMGKWSRLVGDLFLEWLAPAPQSRWIDVGCGNAAFTERLIALCAPSEVQGIDPSEGQLKFARTRPGVSTAHFQLGSAMELPFPNARFDAAVMALVIFFVPDPAVGVAEMRRVVRPGGLVAAYAWDMLGGGFPMEPVLVELRKMGFDPMRPPSIDASRLQAMQDLWNAAGLQQVETREISVQRIFGDFNEFWSACLLGSNLRTTLEELPADLLEQLKQRVMSNATVNPDGSVTMQARANAIKGVVPASLT